MLVALHINTWTIDTLMSSRS